MLKEDRYDQIYAILRERSSATVQYLQKRLYVSEATIRRDLEAMEKGGLIERVWGGAVLRTAEKDIPSFVRLRANAGKKERIASVASRLLKNSATIFFDSSTSCLPLVPYLAKRKDITVITSSLKMSQMLGSRSSAIVNLLGGQVYEGYILTGHTAVESVRNYHANQMFFSCSGLGRDGCVWSIEPRVVEINREMMKRADQKILLCDSSKFGKTQIWQLADIKDIDYVISDAVPEDSALVDALGDKLITSADQLPKT
ncbi:MAG: DeoR/GlpR transcriptional regulator [Oscillospiraceae bacterium]|nr:DeoR/GlpR transcriptional regulator [Oscillospiraceae bacterium]